MDDLENKLGAILNDPDMMQKIMSLASTLNAPPPAPEPPKSEPVQQPQIDLSMLQKLSGLAGQSSIDKNQKNLLHALSPYLSRQRINRLEKAMQAARLAKLASGFLGSGGLQSILGR